MTELDRTLHEHVNYPPHPPRTATALFKHTQHQMIVVEDTPCQTCGVRHSTLSNSEKNLVGATQMEAHHWFIEDSLANAISLEKFNTKLLPYLAARHPDQARYQTPFTQEQMLEWIHGDRDNLRILCDKNHRSKLIGIHAITGPIWNVQDLIEDGFDLTGLVAMTPHEAEQLTALPHTTGTADAPSSE